MGFNIEFQDKDGKVIDFNRLDEEVCKLWNVPFDDEQWASHPGENLDPNWNEFLGRAIMLTRVIKETGTFKPSDLLQGLCLYGCMDPTLKAVEAYQYEIQLLLYWVKQGYSIIVTNRW